MAYPQPVEFRTIDGTTLRGDYYRAEGFCVPVAVMTAGLTMLKETQVSEVAQVFRAAGVASLVYDHRSFGSSGGAPRFDVDPIRHADDFHDAVTAASQLPGADPERVILLGTGHSAGWAAIAAGDDPRVSALILHRGYPQVPSRANPSRLTCSIAPGTNASMQSRKTGKNKPSPSTSGHGRRSPTKPVRARARPLCRRARTTPSRSRWGAALTADQ